LDKRRVLDDRLNQDLCGGGIVLRLRANNPKKSPRSVGVDRPQSLKTCDLPRKKGGYSTQKFKKETKEEGRKERMGRLGLIRVVQLKD